MRSCAFKLQGKGHWAIALHAQSLESVLQASKCICIVPLRLKVRLSGDPLEGVLLLDAVSIVLNLLL